MQLNNKVYDILKWISLIVLDAIGVLYKALSGIWGLPCGDEVVMTCSAISMFIGALIGISTAEYNKSQAEDV